jgi:hypothetical protein
MMHKGSLHQLLAVVLSGATLFSLSACTNLSAVEEGERPKRKDADVRDNMRSIQVAAEHFAGGHGANSYPTQIDDAFKSYLPGGVEGRTPSPVGLVNPFTSANEFPTLGHITDPIAASNGARFALAPGKIEYSPIAGGRGYAIVGGAHDGKVLVDVYNPDRILVLTNVTH